MGACTQAILSWGFVIPEEKLLALLKIFQKNDPEIEPSSDEPPAKKAKTKKKDLVAGFDEAAALTEYIQAALDDKGLSDVFSFVQGGLDHEEQTTTGPITLALYYADAEEVANPDDESVYLNRPYKAERWGSENYGETCLPLGPTLTPELMVKGMEGHAEELHAVLHLKEAGIEVKEQWLLTASLG